MDLFSRRQRHRFFDGGTDEEPPAFEQPPRVLLDWMDPRLDDHARNGERFRMRRRLGYRDEEFGPILVPNDFGHFPTDLTSVPALFTWLVPKTGRHLPAALIHDGLIQGDQEIQDYISLDGHCIDRGSADRIFRNAMRDSDTGVIRRWLIWSAVTLATITEGVEGWTRRQWWRHRITAFGSLLVIAVIGAIATLDLVDAVDWLPWMGERSLGLELVGGFAAAVVIPVLLGLTWGRFAVAGMILGVAAALLFHVTLALAAVSLIYVAAERAASRWPVAVAAVVGLLLVGCLAVALALVATA